MKEMLEQLAKRQCWCDDEDFCVDDYAGGNINDAYENGLDDGETLLARALLKKFAARLD
jgi:hypothetical protein